MGLLSFLTGGSDNTENIKRKVSEGAVIIDVRSKGEFSMGHIENSTNIPLDIIESKTEYLKKLNKPIIFCCASGIRSGNATNYFKKQGLDVINGGGWKELKNKI